jgi:2-hydroxy-6-oxonona-2,4-dienedioate hydrolase
MMMATRRSWLLDLLLLTGGLAIIGGGIARSRFLRALASAESRVGGKSSIIETEFGTMEYAIAGNGPPLLMIHGTGGGFDQGQLFTSALRRRGHRIIAPSRFGYLRSSFPSDPSIINQADAFIALLDQLAIDRLPVIGGSAGALSATAFALRNPDRCSALILLVPAANVDGRDPAALGRFQESVVRALLESDFLYWSMLQAAPEQLIDKLLATDPELLAKVNRTERRRAFAILRSMMPIHARTQGMLNDARQAARPANLDFAALHMPVLLISAEDDRFGTAATARKIAAQVRDAELTIFLDGGHIWLGHDDELAENMARFVERGPA